MLREHRLQIARCFIPVLGIFLGLLLGWILHFLVDVADPSIDLLLRLNTFLFGVAGWAAATVMQGKKLHCGGTLPSDEIDTRRYAVLFLACLFFFILSVVLAVKGLPWLGYPVALVLVSLLIGEIGWGNPLRLIGFYVDP